MDRPLTTHEYSMCIITRKLCENCHNWPPTHCFIDRDLELMLLVCPTCRKVMRECHARLHGGPVSGKTTADRVSDDTATHDDGDCTVDEKKAKAD